MERPMLKYTSTEGLYLGRIIEIHSGSVVIALDGRLGTFHLPKRMIISEHNLAEGQRVGFLMTYPEVLTQANLTEEGRTK